MANARSRRRRKKPWWHRLPLRELLLVRLKDLELDVHGTAVEARVDKLEAELRRAGLRFRPHVWLSTDWYTPDGVTGFAMPFYLAHPRLARIEHSQMFEVEGGTHDWCMQILRHETAHALDNAYRLRRRKRFRETFGPASVPYRDTYAPRPASRDYVQNLDYWYAQSHPLEDWAETFAVWLQPGSRWRTRYAGWPALDKLRYVDELMEEIAAEPPPVKNRTRPDSVSRLRITLEGYYREKKSVYAKEPTSVYDGPLGRLFATATTGTLKRKAARFLRDHRRELRSRVADITGQYRYVVDQVLKTLIIRCSELDLRLTRSEQQTLVDAAILLTVLTMRFVRGRQPEYQR